MKSLEQCLVHRCCDGLFDVSTWIGYSWPVIQLKTALCVVVRVLDNMFKVHIE